MEENKFLGKLIGTVLIGGFILLYLYKSLFITIESGEGGVLYKKFGGGTDLEQTYSEGFHVIAPWNSMMIYEVRQQEVLEKWLYYHLTV